MDRKTFREKWRNASTELDKRKMRGTIDQLNLADAKRGDNRLYLIAMEELSELQQEISRMARGKNGSIIGMVEEMADVCISMERLKRVFGISTNDLYKAINVKIDRAQNILNEKGQYL